MVTLKVPQGVSPSIEYIVLNIDPKGKKKINDDRRPHGEERNIDKVLANGGCSNTHPFANNRAYPKNMPLNKVLYLVHTANLNKKKHKPKKCLSKTNSAFALQAIFQYFCDTRSLPALIISNKIVFILWLLTLR